MRNHQSAYTRTLWFKRWSRHADAAFLSIGKVVHIGRLKVDICRMALLKSGAMGVVALLLQLYRSLVEENDLADLSDVELTEQQLLQLMPIVIAPRVAGAAPSPKKILHNTIPLWKVENTIGVGFLFLYTLKYNLYDDCIGGLCA